MLEVTKDEAVLGGDKILKAPRDQVSEFDPQQVGAGQVDGTDVALAIEGEIADRSEIVEEGVLVARRILFFPGLA